MIAGTCARSAADVLQSAYPRNLILGRNPSLYRRAVRVRHGLTGITDSPQKSHTRRIFGPAPVAPAAKLVTADASWSGPEAGHPPMPPLPRRAARERRRATAPASTRLRPKTAPFTQRWTAQAPNSRDAEPRHRSRSSDSESDTASFSRREAGGGLPVQRAGGPPRPAPLLLVVVGDRHDPPGQPLTTPQQEILKRSPDRQVSESSTWRSLEDLPESVIMVVAIVDADTGALAEAPTSWPAASSTTPLSSRSSLSSKERWPTPPKRAWAIPTSSNNSSHAPWPTGPSAPTGAGP